MHPESESTSGSAPVARITPERHLIRKNAGGEVTHRIARNPDGSLRYSESNMSVEIGPAALIHWLEQEGTALTWHRGRDELDLVPCLVDGSGNVLWREHGDATPPPAEPHDYGGPAMGRGARLRRQSLTSRSGAHTLQHRVAGNLVLLCTAAVTDTPVWTSGTDWVGDSWLDLTRDGDLVLRNSCGTPVWRSETEHAGAERLAVGDDGTLALLDAAGAAVWQAGDHAPCTAAGRTPPRGSVLRRGETLRNQSLASPDGNSVLTHEECDVWLFRGDGRQVWRAGERRAEGGLTLDGDGYLRTLAAGGGVCEHLAGPGDRLVLVSGGEIRMYAKDGGVVWREGQHVIDGPDNAVVRGLGTEGSGARAVPPAALEALLNADATPIVRTDFSDDRAWQDAWEDVMRVRQYWDEDTVLDAALIDLADFDGWTGEELATALLPQDVHGLVLVVDAATLAAKEHPVLVVEVDDEEGGRPRSFRAIPHALLDAAINLSLANMEWEDFSDRVDPDGVLRHSFMD